MPNKKTVALTKEQYMDIMDAMETGGYGFRPNKTIAMALRLEANLGLRLSDIVPYTDKHGKAHHGLRLCDIVREAGRYHLSIAEVKTGKPRTFTVPQELYSYIQGYCIDNGIGKTDPICPVSERRVQKYLESVCSTLDSVDEPFINISTHSFRKFYATDIYVNNGYDIVLVQKLLQHSSPAITQRYIGIDPQQVETAIQNHLCL